MSDRVPSREEGLTRTLFAFLRSLFDRAVGIGARGVAIVSRPNHFEEEPYRLYVDPTRDTSYGDAAVVLNRFESPVARLWLADNGPAAVWVLSTSYAWGNISVRLFGDVYQAQMKFMRKEEALRFIEDRLGITRTAEPPKRLKPLPGKTMWETEDADV